MIAWVEDVEVAAQRFDFRWVKLNLSDRTAEAMQKSHAPFDQRHFWMLRHSFQQGLIFVKKLLIWAVYFAFWLGTKC